MTLKRILGIGVAMAGLTVGGAAMAQMNLSGWYVGGGVGKSKVDIDNANISAQVLTVPGITSAATSSDDNDTGWKFFAGYQFHPNFAAEVTYANLGKFSFLTTTTPTATFSGEVKIENTWSFDLLGIWPVGNNFSVLGRVGLLYAEAKSSLTGTGPGGRVILGGKEDDWNWKLGLGVGYEFTPQLGVRAEWERYRVPDGFGDKADADLFSVSLRFKF